MFKYICKTKVQTSKGFQTISLKNIQVKYKKLSLSKGNISKLYFDGITQTFIYIHTKPHNDKMEL